MSFFEQALNSTSERSQRISNRKQRDVSTTVDMTSTRFSECGSTAILLPFFLEIKTASKLRQPNLLRTILFFVQVFFNTPFNDWNWKSG